MNEDTTQNSVEDSENLKFLGRLVGPGVAVEITKGTASLETAKKALDDAEKYLRKGHAGFNRRGAQFLELYGKEVDFKNPDSVGTFVDYLHDNFVDAIATLRKYVERMSPSEGGSSEDGDGEVTQAPAQRGPNDPEVMALVRDIENGAKNQYHAAEVLKNNVVRAFDALMDVRIPAKGTVPDAETAKRLSDAASAFSKAITYNMGHDLTLLLDFYEALSTDPERAEKRFPLLREMDAAHTVASLEALIDYFEEHGELPSGKKSVVKPGSSAPLSGDMIPSSIREHIKQIASGNLDPKKCSWLPEASKLTPSGNIVEGLAGPLKVHALDLRGHSEDLAEALNTLITEPFGKDGMGILNTNLSELEDKVVGGLEDFRNQLGNRIKEISQVADWSGKRKKDEGYMEGVDPRYVRKAIRPNVKSPFKELPQQTDILPVPYSAPVVGAVDKMVTDRLIKAFPTKDLPFTRTMKDVGAEWAKNTSPSPMEGIRDNLVRAFRTLSSLDLEKVRKMSEDFSADSPDSYKNVARANIQDMDAHLASLSELAEDFKAYFKSRSGAANPFGDVKDLSGHARVKARKFDKLFAKAVSATRSSIIGALDLRPGSAGFLSIDANKALEPLKVFVDEGDRSYIDAESMPEFLKEEDPGNDALGTSEMKTALYEVANKARYLVSQIDIHLKAVRKNYLETTALMKEVLNSIPRFPVEGEELKKSYERALQEPTYRHLLTGDTSGLSHTEMSKGRFKAAAEQTIKAKLNKAVTALDKGLNSILGLSDKVIPDLSKDEVFERLADFENAKKELSKDMSQEADENGNHPSRRNLFNMDEGLVRYIVARTSPGALHKFISDYVEFTDFAKSLKKAHNAVGDLSLVLSEALSEAFGVPQVKMASVSGLLRKAASLLEDKSIVEAARLIRKVAWDPFSAPAPKKLGVAEESSLELDKKIKKYRGIQESIAKALDHLNRSVEDAYSSAAGDIDYDQIREALKAMKGITDYSSAAASTFNSLTDMLNEATAGESEDVLGENEYGSDKDVRFHQKESNVDNIHSAFTALSSVATKLRDELETQVKKEAEYAQKLREYSDLSDKALKDVKILDLGLQHGKVPSSSFRSLTSSDGVGGFIKEQARAVGEHGVLEALQGLTDIFSRYKDTETPEGGKSPLIVTNEDKYISGLEGVAEPHQLEDKLKELEKIPDNETPEEAKIRKDEMEAIRENIKNDTEDLSARQEAANQEAQAKARYLVKKNEAARDANLATIRGFVDRLYNTAKPTKRSLKGDALVHERGDAYDDLAKKVDDTANELTSIKKSVPNVKAGLDTFLKSTLRGEKEQVKQDRSYLNGIEDKPFSSNYQQAMDSAVAGNFQAAIGKSLSTNSQEGAKFLKNSESLGTPVSKLFQKFHTLSQNKNLTPADAEIRDALKDLLTAWPDKSISSAAKTLDKIHTTAEYSADPTEWEASDKATDMLAKAVETYEDGTDDTMADAVHAQLLQIEDDKDPVFVKMSSLLKGLPSTSTRQEIEDLEKELVASSKTKEGYKELMGNPDKKDQFLEKSQQAKALLDELHPKPSSGRAHQIAQKVLGKFRPGSSSIKDAVESELVSEVARPGERKISPDEVRHAMLEMSAVHGPLSYQKAKGALSDRKWESRDVDPEDLTSLYRSSQDYASGMSTPFGSNAHSKVRRALRADKTVDRPEGWHWGDTNPPSAADWDTYFAGANESMNRKVQATLPAGQKAIRVYAKHLMGKLPHLMAERANMQKAGDSDENKESLVHLNRAIDDIKSKLDTFHGNRRAGISGSDKELASEAVDFFKKNAQESKDKAYALSTYLKEKAKAKTDRTDKGEASAKRAKELEDRYGFDESTSFEDLAEESTKHLAYANEIGKGVLGSKHPIELEGGGTHDTAKFDKFFSSGTGYGAGRIDQSEISSQKSMGSDERYMDKEAQEFLTHWVNHLKDSGATNFTDDGYLYKMIDDTVEKSMERIRASYKGDRIGGFEIDGVKHPGIIDELKQEKKHKMQLIEQLKKADKEMSEAMHPLMNDIAKIVQDNSEEASKVNSQIDKYYDDYEDVSSQHAKEDNLKRLGLEEDYNGDVGPVGIGAGSAGDVRRDLRAAVTVGMMTPDEYATRVKKLGDKLNEIRKTGDVDANPLTAQDYYILGPELSRKIVNATTGVDASGAAAQVLDNETDRFRDLKEEGKELAGKLAVLTGDSAKVLQHLKNSPMTFSEREFDLMGPVLASKVQSILEGTAGKGKSSIQGNYADVIKDQVDKKEKSLHKQTSRTLLGERSLRDARILHNLLENMAELKRDHVDRLARITDEAESPEEKEEGIRKENLAYEKRLARYDVRKLKLSRSFQDALSKATNGEGVTPENTDEVRDALEGAFAHMGGPVAPSELSTMKKLEADMAELEDLESSTIPSADPTSIKKHEEKVQALRSSTKKALNKLRKSDHPSTRNLTDIVDQRAQANLESGDTAALKRVREWLGTPEGESLADNGDASGLFENHKILQDLRRVSSRTSPVVESLRPALSVAITSNVSAVLNPLAQKIKSKTYSSDDLQAFAQKMAIASIFYENLSAYFPPADIRSYQEAKSLSKQPFVKAKILSEESAMEHPAGGMSSVFDRLKGLEDHEDLDPSEKEEVRAALERSVKNLVEQAQNVMVKGASKIDPADFTKEGPLRDIHKVIEEHPEAIPGDFAKVLKRFEDKVKDVSLNSRASKVIEELSDLQSSSSDVSSPSWVAAVKGAKRLLGDLDSHNTTLSKDLKSRVEEALNAGSAFMASLAQQKVDQALEAFASFAEKVKGSADWKEYSDFRSTLVKSLKDSLEAVSSLPQKGDVVAPTRIVDKIKASVGGYPDGTPFEKVSNHLEGWADSVPHLLSGLSDSVQGDGSSVRGAASPEGAPMSKKAGGSDDAGGSFDKQNWALENATAWHPGADNQSTSKSLLDRRPTGLKRHKDLESRDKVIKELHKSYDRIVQSQGKGRTLQETKVDHFPQDSLVGAGTNALEAIHHFQNATGIRKGHAGLGVSDLASQVHAIAKHEKKHGADKLDESQKRLVAAVKSRWTALEKKLQSALSGADAKLRSAKATGAEESIIKALEGRKDKISRNLAKHAEVTKKGADYEGDATHEMLTELHTLSLGVERRLAELVQVMDGKGRKSKMKVSEALSHLHEAIHQLSADQSKIRNHIEKNTEAVEDLDDLIDGWSQSLSYAQSNNGNGLSPQQEKVWSRLLLNKMMHWLMWVWNRNSGTFEKAYNATDADYQGMSEAIQSRLGMFNNPRINRLMVGLTDLVDRVGKQSYKGMPAAQAQKLNTLKQARSRLFMYKYSMAHLQDVLDNIEMWADKHGVELDPKEKKEVQSRLDKSMREAVTLAAEAAHTLEEFKATAESAESLGTPAKEQPKEDMAKYASMSLGSFSEDAIQRIINRFNNGE